jgi:tetratricopeptide (TPR) repeat protein
MQIEDHHLPEWWPQCELLAPHIQSLTAWQEISSKANPQFLLANHQRAVYLEARGRYVEAEDLYTRLIADRDGLSDSNLEETLRLQHDLARVYCFTGRYKDAETLLRHVWRNRVYGKLEPRHRSTLGAMYQLALVFDKQERYDEAEAFLKRALRDQDVELGSEDGDTLRTMCALACVYRSQGQYEYAERLLKRVLQAEKKIHGPEHIYTFRTMHELAVLYHAQGRHDDAEVLLKRVLQTREKWLGTEHPETLATQQALANVYLSKDAHVDRVMREQQIADLEKDVDLLY